MKTKDSPSDNAYSHFICEEATVVNVNRANWTVTVTTTHTSKTLTDVRWAVPYVHHAAGEGYHFIPEIGAACYLAHPNDNTPGFVMGFVAQPDVKEASGEDPARSTSDPAGSKTDVSYQNNRPDLNPGDLAMSTRDGNFIILRRGGVLQLGATPLAQRICVPIRNFVHDFAENYELVTPGGDVSWIIDRPEFEPAGKAPCSYTFHLQEFAPDKSATVRVRHLPLSGAGGKKAAWEVTVAPNGIARTGEVSGATYTLLVLTDGTKAEMIGADRSVEVKGDDALEVAGKQVITVGGKASLEAASIEYVAKGSAALAAKTLSLGELAASEPALLGNAFVQWLQTATVITQQGPAFFSPAAIAAFQAVLSRRVTLV